MNAPIKETITAKEFEDEVKRLVIILDKYEGRYLPITRRTLKASIKYKLSMVYPIEDRDFLTLKYSDYLS